jgi:gamma-glutamylcyclotransferase (GGCT)/AIG2-like uncharacterized protein YtfP
MGEELVFVYGTLRTGLRNHHLLSKEKLVCPKSNTESLGRLLVFYDRPFLLFDEKKYTIRGELYRVSSTTLGLLDKLEGHPRWYIRTHCRIYCSSLDTLLMANCYLLHNAPEKSFCIEASSGCFAEYMGTYKGESAKNFQIVNGRIIRKK